MTRNNPLKFFLLASVLVCSGCLSDPVEQPQKMGGVRNSPATEGTLADLLVSGGASYVNITTLTTTLVKTGAGALHTVCVNGEGVSGTIELDDALTNTTPIIGKITLPSTITGVDPFCMTYDVAFTVGLSVTTAVAATNDTISFR
jgi:hypothetical protein